MQEQNLTYEQVIKLGFKRIEGDDRVFEKRYGFKYFYVEKKFPKNVSVDWDIQTNELKIYKEGNGIRKITPSELKFLIEIFK